MIVVDHLSKTFPGGPAGRPALREVSFTAHPGEVLGFLGQNGAGKTTTLRILAGYLRPSAGQASICGHDVVRDALQARRHLGYLPEQVPLYPELRVHEYLRHRAELKGVPRSQRRGAIAQVLDQVGLGGAESRLIGQLSKGFRQRVGLADALLHQPPVLILDEPTDGLDPNQRAEALALITALGRERTVILSTHVLPEVEGLCQRLVILDRGQVVASGTPAEISRRLRSAGQIDLTVRGPLVPVIAALRAVPGVAQVTSLPPADAAPDGPHQLRVQLQLASDAPDEDAVGRTCEALAQAVTATAALRHIAPVRSSLDAVFRGLTSEPPSQDPTP